jgi:ATP-dependent DNA helicase RecQ
MPVAAPPPALPAALRRTLRETFGLRTLREGQREVIARVLAGRDTLAIMPTGAGKSLCWQLPSLHLEGTTIVVSPLIALMKDQADRLGEAGVAAEQLHSARPASEQDASLARIVEERSDIVFATPERLADPAFLDTLQGQRIALFVIDEAHCISQWGHDFRPAYLELGAALAALGDPPLLALTATATDAVVEDIRQRLGRPRLEIVATGLYRANLRLQVAQVTNEEEHAARLLELLGRAGGQGIVYCATVKACTAVHERLVAAGEAATIYHGRLGAGQRNANQDRFMRGEARTMVATNAFGMGIDKADLRFVIHYQLPGSPQAYYQEAGRAGRDGSAADCVLLFHRRDRQVQQFFLAKRHPDGAELARVLEAVAAAPERTTAAQAQERLPDVPATRLAVMLSLLRDAGLLKCDRRRAWQRVDAAPAAPATTRRALEDLAAANTAQGENDRAALERMVFYAQTGFCRWRVLLEALDEPLPFDGGCGHCDNCLRPPPAEPAVRPDPLHRPLRRTARKARFAEGEAVRVPKYGDGRVVAAAGDEVTVSFPDGAQRTFMAAYVTRGERPNAAVGSAN